MSVQTKADQCNLNIREEPALLWDEYKYRYEHCWQMIYRLTYAAVILGAVPYLDKDRFFDLGLWIIAPPLIAVALIIFQCFGYIENWLC